MKRGNLVLESSPLFFRGHGRFEVRHEEAAIGEPSNNAWRVFFLFNFDLPTITLVCPPIILSAGTPPPPLPVAALMEREKQRWGEGEIKREELAPSICREKHSEVAEVMEAAWLWYVDLGLKGNNTFHTGKKRGVEILPSWKLCQLTFIIPK